jgi:hypothetical protein
MAICRFSTYYTDSKWLQAHFHLQAMLTEADRKETMNERYDMDSDIDAVPALYRLARARALFQDSAMFQRLQIT